MPNWKAEFAVKDLLNHDDVEQAEAQRLRDALVSRLRRSPFEHQSRQALIRRFELVSDQQDFNDALDYLYDVADMDRVWIK